MTYSLIVTCLLAATALWTAPATGASTAQLLAASDENGKISRLDLKAREVVVGDTLFRLSPRVSVYSTNGFQTTAASLRKGMFIAFNITSDATGSPYIAMIWILPTN